MPTPIQHATAVRHPWPLWIAVLLFLVVAFSMPLMCTSRRKARTPKNLTELAERIQAKHTRWRIVPMHKNGSVASGFWICDRERSWDELNGLPPSPQFMEEWVGTVAVVQKQGYPDVNLGWRDLGCCTAFGDETMIRALAGLPPFSS